MKEDKRNVTEDVKERSAKGDDAYKDGDKATPTAATGKPSREQVINAMNAAGANADVPENVRAVFVNAALKLFGYDGL